MKPMYKCVLAIALVVSLGITATVFAFGGHRYGWCGCAGLMGGPGPMMSDGGGPRFWRGEMDSAKTAEECLTSIKERLKIAPEQEAVWNQFAAEARKQLHGFALARDAQFKQRREQSEQSAPERFGQFAAFMRERLTAMERLQEPFKQLYDNLTPDQRKALDQVFGPKRFRA